MDVIPYGEPVQMELEKEKSFVSGCNIQLSVFYIGLQQIHHVSCIYTNHLLYYRNHRELNFHKFATLCYVFPHSLPIQKIATLFPRLHCIYLNNSALTAMGVPDGINLVVV